MLKLRLFVGICSVSLMVFGAGGISGQNYPNKPIRIVTSEPAGGTDFVARLIAHEISGGLGQNVIIENRPSSVVGDFAAKAPPDGHTLVVAATIFWIGPLLQKMSYDPLRDFVPITSPAISPSVVVVHPSLPVKSVRDLIALAKTRPGELNYGSTGTGGTSHLGAELFKSMAGVNIVRINFRGQAAALNAMLGGEVQLLFATSGSVAPHIRSGRFRALAVTSAQPSVLLPGLPTVSASGLPGFESATNYGVFAPAKTPRPIIDRLNQEVVRLLARADVKSQFLNAGLETVGNSPEEFAAAIKSEYASTGKLIRDAGIRLD